MTRTHDQPELSVVHRRLAAGPGPDPFPDLAPTPDLVSDHDLLPSLQPAVTHDVPTGFDFAAGLDPSADRTPAWSDEPITDARPAPHGSPSTGANPADVIDLESISQIAPEADASLGLDTSPTVDAHAERAAYALGVLDPEGEARFEAHLSSCDDCKAELGALRLTVGMLPYALAPEYPATGARDRLLARMRGRVAELRSGNLAQVEIVSDEVAALPTRRRGQPATDVPTAEALAAALAPIPSRRSRPQGPPQSPQAVLKIKPASIGWAIVLLFVVVSGLVIGVWSATAPHLSVDIALMAHLPGGRILSFRGTGAPDATARLYVVEGGRRAELVVSGLPALPDGRVYQVWLAEVGQPIRAGGTFYVNRKGDAVIRATAGIPAERMESAIVTQEPVPGSASPTGPRMLGWTP